MKRFISALLCFCLLLGLAACAKGEGGETTAVKSSFRVGYSKVNITPSSPMILDGYGAVAGGGRYFENVLDYLYLTCVAISDENDNTVLMCSVDVVKLDDAAVVPSLKKAVSTATGISEDNLFFTATHTHSAPRNTDMGNTLKQAALQAAEEALADRKPAEMYFGKDNTSGISFIRHYYAEDGSVVTDNHGDENATLVSHTTEIDEEMRILQFKREGGKDVVLANWQCHPHLTGGSVKYDLSADIVGAMRMYMEQEDYLFAYYQGGAGNINWDSRIRSEMAITERDHKQYGQAMANTAKKALQNMTKLETGEIKVITESYSCDYNKEEYEKLGDAALIMAYHREGEGGSRPSWETKDYAESLNCGIYSYYHAGSLQSRFSKPDTFDVSLSVIEIGDFAWSTMPGEFFDSTVKYIRDNSPYTYNFSSAYTNGGQGYFPSQEAWDYGCYEADTSVAAPGTAEAIADHLLEMLNKLHD